jgi:predicted enzyme related to lactoylglutathione lyase
MASLKLTTFVLFVKDVTISKEFYEKILDQEVVLNIQNINIGFKSGLGLWQKQYAENLIFEKEIKPNDAPGKFEVYFETSQVDELFDKIQKSNIKVLHPIKTQPWQQRVFRMYDPDDHIIEVGETMENVVKRLYKSDMSIESISEKTFMPKEVVEAMLK